MVISTVSLEAFSTFEKISLGAFNSSQSTVVNSILDKLFSLFPDLIASHFLGGHTGQPFKKFNKELSRIVGLILDQVNKPK